MQFTILKKQVDEAGNVGFVFSEEFHGTEDDCLSRLVLISSFEACEYVAEFKHADGTRLLSCPYFKDGEF